MLALDNISKSFGAVQVLRGISLTVESGQVLALMGENGAGKSTLMNIISGVYSDYSGTVSVAGEACHFSSPRDAEMRGVGMVHQELNLVGELSVAENIFLGREPKGLLGLIDFPAMEKKAAEILQRLGLDVAVDQALSNLRVGEQQVVEIARALVRETKILILDEPTAALTQTEAEKLFALVEQLAGEGVAVVYISHRLDELFRLASHAAVLRDGQLVLHEPMAQCSREQLISAMVGQDIDHFYRRVTQFNDRQRLSLSGITQLAEQPAFTDISFSVREGEVLGLTGLMGSGIGELLEALGGAQGGIAGDAILDDAVMMLDSPSTAIKQGIALVTDDRKRDALVLEQSIAFNLQLPSLCTQTSALPAEQNSSELVSRLGIKSDSAQQAVGELSGGNQQKVVLGRWWPQEPKLLLLNEPTRGVDVGAKLSIYKLIEQAAEQGAAIIVAGTDLVELMAVCDRIGVMKAGHLVSILGPAEFSQEKLLTLAASDNNDEVAA
jgi:ribose transport system ATP-binding protein